jgi:HAMP domain-containing protein
MKRLRDYHLIVKLGFLMASIALGVLVNFLGVLYFILDQEKLGDGPALAHTDVKQFMVFLLILLVVNLGSIVVGFYIINRQVVEPVRLMADVSNKLSAGDLSTLTTYDSKDEIGQVFGNIRAMVSNLEQASEFATKVGAGVFNYNYSPASAHDKLGMALVTMGRKLEEIGKEDKKKNWTTQGLAEIGTILRRTYTTTEVLFDSIIQFVVKYTNSNQGALYSCGAGE